MRKKRSKRKERRGNREIHNGRPRFFFTSHLLLYVSTCTLLARFYTATGYSYTSLIAAFATTFPRKSAEGKNEAEKCLVFFSVSNVFNDFTCRWRGCTYTRASTLISPPEQQRNSFIVTRSISGWKYIRPTRTYECTHCIYVCVCVRERESFSAMRCMQEQAVANKTTYLYATKKKKRKKETRKREMKWTKGKSNDGETNNSTYRDDTAECVSQINRYMYTGW